MENYLPGVKASISNAVAKGVEGASEVAILFSGGLDSSLIALLANYHAENAEITLYTVGTADSHDFSNIEQASKLLGLNSRRIEICIEDITGAVPKLFEITDCLHPVAISFELPLYFALERIDEKLVLSGQGADELFGGYARYLRMEGEVLKNVMKKDIDTLITNGIEMEYKIAKHFGKLLKTPYLDEEVVRTAMQIPIEYKVNEGQRKIVLREVALRLGLPAKLANKQKKASQYSSGILKELRKMAKNKGMGVNELIEHLL